MQRILLCALFCAASLSAVTPAFAWMSKPARNPDNGHYYALFTGETVQQNVPPAMRFADALTFAASMSHSGIPGHLATITSQSEQNFVRQYFSEWRRFPSRYLPNDIFWIAASDAAVEGEWRWVAGPETGQLFWQGNQNGVALGYQNWQSFNGRLYEPNNYNPPDGEDFVALHLSVYSQSEPWWNDVSARDDFMTYVPRVGIVEFTPIPEPSSATLTAILGAMFVAACRRRG